MKFRRISSFRRGSALISTLLVITVLTIIVVAFLQSMTSERQVARSYMNRLRAELAAESAVNDAVELVRRYISRHPDSATFWDPAVTTGDSILPATLLFFHETSPVTQTSGELPLPRFIPLTSGAIEQDYATHGSRSGSIDTSEGTVNINREELGFGKGPWIGEFPVGSKARELNPTSKIEPPWVLIRESEDADAKPIARYAFWVEDESFRVNVNAAGTTPRGSQTDGVHPADIPLQGPIAAVPGGQSGSGDAFAARVFDIRQISSLGHVPTDATIERTLEGTSLDLGQARFLFSIHSEGANLSRLGKRRIDLSEIVTNAPDTARDEVLRIAGFIKEQAPSFGQRFWSPAESNDVPEDEADLYIERIAANIRDFIDQDSNPTMLDRNGDLHPGGAPEFAIGTPGSENDFRTIGKEAIPRLQETLLRVKQGSGMGGVGATSSPYRIAISHYLEFWNPTGRDIHPEDLASSPGADDAFILIANQPGWEDAGTERGKIAPFFPPDLAIPLKSFVNAAGEPLVFKAGTVTVLTNDPEPETLVGPTAAHIFKTIQEADAVFRAPGFEFVATGTVAEGTHLRRNNRGGYGGRPTLQMMTRHRPPSQPTSPAEDYDTEIALANGRGWLDSHAQAVPITAGIFVDSFGSKSNNQFFHLRGGVLRGNSGFTGTNAPNQFGDPTANLEPRQFSPSGAKDPAATGFFSWRTPTASQSSIDSAQRSSIGKPNATSADPSGWADRLADGFETTTAPYVVRNTRLRSVGDLGSIYDPRRDSQNPHAQGGGRTLRIGQREWRASDPPLFPVWDGDPRSVSRNRVAWRLTDIFGTRVEPSIPGLVNLNGILRDGGIALKAALHEFTFTEDTAVDRPFGDPKRSGKELTPAETEKLVESLIARIAPELAETSDTVDEFEISLPLMERGELSEIDFFHDGSAGAVQQQDVLDRSREEIFRRLVELTCTRGNVFSVYAIGQAVREQSNGDLRVLSTQTRKVTFRLQLKGGDAQSGYDIEILSTTP